MKQKTHNFAGTRKVVKPFRCPTIVGQIAERAREIVLRDASTLNVVRVERAVRIAAARLCEGEFVKIVSIAGRKAIHTGPFPLDGYEIVDSVYVAAVDLNTGALITTRPANYKKTLTGQDKT